VEQRRLSDRAAGAAAGGLTLLPGVLVVGFAFASGGYQPDAVALVAGALTVMLALRVALIGWPLSTLSAGYVAGAGALALLAGWTYVSGTWSAAPARATIEYDRALLYLLAFVACGSFGYSAQRFRWMLRGLAAAALVVCLCGLTTRLAPDLWATAISLEPERLSYPMGYWNALGLLAALGIVVSFGLTADDREVATVKVLAAAALPALGATLLLTFSRGSIAAATAGLLALIVVGRPRALLGALLVAAPAVGLAAVSVYNAKLLATTDPTSAAATAQGHDVAFVLAACATLAGIARAALLTLDDRMRRLAMPAALRRRSVAGAAIVLAAAAAVAVGITSGGPAFVEGQYDRFVHGNDTNRPAADVRGRLGDSGNNGRIQQWRVALDAFDREPLHGKGAGTYALAWERHRPATYQVEDAHSLYAEMLGELGIVGAVLVVLAIVLALAGFVFRARGPDRALGGAAAGCAVAWALHAGIDWDWEMPAVTAWLFAAAGLALAASHAEQPRPGGRVVGRVVAGVACLSLAVLPARVFVSERALRDGARAFAAGNCDVAVDRALDAVDAFNIRPEPFIVLGYCDVRLGRPALAVRAMQSAVRKDPENWEGHYGLALAQATGGRDPRPSLRTALRYNPREGLLVRTRDLLGSEPEDWARLAPKARLPAQ